MKKICILFLSVCLILAAFPVPVNAANQKRYIWVGEECDTSIDASGNPVGRGYFFYCREYDKFYLTTDSECPYCHEKTQKYIVNDFGDWCYYYFFCDTADLLFLEYVIRCSDCLTMISYGKTKEATYEVWNNPLNPNWLEAGFRVCENTDCHRALAEEDDVVVSVAWFYNNTISYTSDWSPSGIAATNSNDAEARQQYYDFCYENLLNESSETPVTKLTFWDKILAFFKSIADFFSNLF